MPKPTGPTNPIIASLIEEIRNRGYRENIPFLIKLADELEKPRRRKTEVNLSKLNKICKENETVVVPGKVLSSGTIKKPIKVAASSFSMSAIEKIQKSGGKVLTIEELIKENPKGTNVKIVI
ncbi:MAG: 50S ribosomal protein L18e [Candidatus Aenigmatarchaeota archaeon]